MNIIHIFLQADIFVKFIVLFLLGYSVVSLAIIIQKWTVTNRAKKQVKDFHERFWSVESLDSLHNAIIDNEVFLTGTEKIFFAGYKEFKRVSALPYSNSNSVVESSIRAMNLTAIQELEGIRKNLSFLAVVSSSSPYIGLFGTVWGVISAFTGLAAKQSSLQSIAPGMAGALISTFAGLFAAIPAVIAFNAYTSKIDALEQDYYNFIDEFTAVLHRRSLNSK